MTILKMENNVDFYLLACVLLLSIVFFKKKWFVVCMCIDAGSGSSAMKPHRFFLACMPGIADAIYSVCERRLIAGSADC